MNQNNKKVGRYGPVTKYDVGCHNGFCERRKHGRRKKRMSNNSDDPISLFLVKLWYVTHVVLQLKVVTINGIPGRDTFHHLDALGGERERRISG